MLDTWADTLATQKHRKPLETLEKIAATLAVILATPTKSPQTIGKSRFLALAKNF
jgi:hypothetical protein